MSNDEGSTKLELDSNGIPVELVILCESGIFLALHFRVPIRDPVSTVDSEPSREIVFTGLSSDLAWGKYPISLSVRATYNGVGYNWL
jgi:hypothetical protein